jgi:FHA domain
MADNLDISTRITNNRGKLSVRRKSARSRACLVQYSGDTLGRRYLLDAPEITIGRSSVNGIVIHDDSVSREHAKIISRSNVVAVEDLGSSNGTFIQDEPVLSRTSLKDSDMLRVGNILLKFFVHDNIYRMATIDAGTQLFNKNICSRRWSRNSAIAVFMAGCCR